MHLLCYLIISSLITFPVFWKGYRMGNSILESSKINLVKMRLEEFADFSHLIFAREMLPRTALNTWQENLPLERRKDPWGSVFRLDAKSRVHIWSSAGADQKWDTEDDIQLRVRAPQKIDGFFPTLKTDRGVKVH